jgi:transglutaminase-like putative cysteine protease
VCLKPKDLEGQVCDSFKLEITPSPNEIIERKDYFGNTVHYFSIHVPHQELTVLAVSKVQSLPKVQLNISRISVQDCKNMLWNNRELKVELLQYMTSSPFINWDTEILEFARTCLKIMLYFMKE